MYKPSIGMDGGNRYSADTTNIKHLDSQDESRHSEDSVYMTGCDSGPVSHPAVDLMVAIVSDAGHVERRTYLRRTWARQNHIFPVIRFFVGKSDKDTVNKRIEEEAKHFHDVCIIQLVDNYAALPRKVGGGSYYTVFAQKIN